jgi:UDP:flavonoid glycosyltransferase YjiC (YdhE family)
MKILLAAFGTRGDVQPMLALGVRLRADGHEVAIGASPGFADWVRGHGLAFHGVGGDLEAWARGHGELARSPARFIKPAVDFLRREVGLSLDQTHAAARGADVIVSGIHPAAPSVAEALGLPHRTLLFCPQMLVSRQHPPPGVAWFSLPGFCNQALWWVFRRGFDLMLRDPLNRRRRQWGLPPVIGVLDYLLTDRTIVASDALLGELPPDASSGTAQIGSLVLAEGGVLEPALERFLADGEPPVYIGFGSMPDADPRTTTRALLEALEACRRRGVIHPGWAGLGAGGVPPGVFLSHSAPHTLLLPRVALAVHHGGAGTTAAAARAGIPQVVVPHCVDQLYWGHQIHERGLGSRPIPRASLTAARLADAIGEVLSRPTIAERAREVRAGLERTDGVPALIQLLYEAASSTPALRAAA